MRNFRVCFRNFNLVLVGSIGYRKNLGIGSRWKKNEFFVFRGQNIEDGGHY